MVLKIISFPSCMNDDDNTRFSYILEEFVTQIGEIIYNKIPRIYDAYQEYDNNQEEITISLDTTKEKAEFLKEYTNKWIYEINKNHDFKEGEVYKNHIEIAVFSILNNKIVKSHVYLQCKPVKDTDITITSETGDLETLSNIPPVSVKLNYSALKYSGKMVDDYCQKLFLGSTIIFRHHK